MDRRERVISIEKLKLTLLHFTKISNLRDLVRKLKKDYFDPKKNGMTHVGYGKIDIPSLRLTSTSFDSSHRTTRIRCFFCNSAALVHIDNIECTETRITSNGQKVNENCIYVRFRWKRHVELEYLKERCRRSGLFFRPSPGSCLKAVEAYQRVIVFFQVNMKRMKELEYEKRTETIRRRRREMEKRKKAEERRKGFDGDSIKMLGKGCVETFKGAVKFMIPIFNAKKRPDQSSNPQVPRMIVRQPPSLFLPQQIQADHQRIMQSYVPGYQNSGSNNYDVRNTNQRNLGGNPIPQNRETRAIPPPVPQRREDAYSNAPIQTSYYDFSPSTKPSYRYRSTGVDPICNNFMNLNSCSNQSFPNQQTRNTGSFNQPKYEDEDDVILDDEDEPAKNMNFPPPKPLCNPPPVNIQYEPRKSRMYTEPENVGNGIQDNSTSCGGDDEDTFGGSDSGIGGLTISDGDSGDSDGVRVDSDGNRSQVESDFVPDFY